MEQMGRIIRIKPEAIAEYKRLHADVWPQVLERITACNIRNYTIFLRQPENLLFAYWEYHGSDFDADMAKMAEDEATQRWWVICDPMQEVLESCTGDERWATMENVFHHD